MTTDKEGCAECLEHSAGICFSHKMKHWRSTGHSMAIAGRKSGREMMEEEFELAAANGRQLRVKE